MSPRTRPFRQRACHAELRGDRPLRQRNSSASRSRGATAMASVVGVLLPVLNDPEIIPDVPIFDQ
jgi:hypothetical protein